MDGSVSGIAVAGVDRYPVSLPCLIGVLLQRWVIKIQEIMWADRWSWLSLFVCYCLVSVVRVVNKVI